MAPKADFVKKQDVKKQLQLPAKYFLLALQSQGIL